MKRLALDADRSDPDGCWLWLGFLDKDGYGGVKRDGQWQRAHRVEYAAVHGPIPDGLEIDHLCRNRSCVNPGHLEAVTRLVNVSRQRSANREKMECNNGHGFTPENTYTTKRRRHCRTCNRASVAAYQKRKRGAA